MKTQTRSDENRRESTFERWRELLAACSLSLILACTSPVGPEAPDGNALRGGDENEPDVEEPIVFHDLRDGNDDEWPGEGSGEQDDWRKWLW